MKRKKFLVLTTWMFVILPYSMLITYATPPRKKISLPDGKPGSTSLSSSSTSDQSNALDPELPFQDQSSENYRQDSIVSQRKVPRRLSPHMDEPAGQYHAVMFDLSKEDKKPYLQQRTDFRRTLQTITPDDIRKPMRLCTDLGEKLKEEYKINTENGITIERNIGFGCLEDYVVSNDTIKYKSNFLRTPLVMTGKKTGMPSKVNFEHLYIVGENNICVFKNLDISGEIQISFESTVVFINCNINCDSMNTDGSVEILAGAKVEFRNCSLDIKQQVSSSTLGLYIRGMGKCLKGINTQVCFNKCKLKGGNTGIKGCQSAIIQLFDCELSNCSNVALFLAEKTTSLIRNCKFTCMVGKPIFINDNSKVEIEGCEFNGCKKGGVTVCRRSKVKVFYCKFFDLGSTALRFVGSEMNVSDCCTQKVAGNCLNIDSSEGQVKNCKFSSNVGFPLIAVVGQDSSPTIEDCSIEQLSNFSESSILVQEYASPVFKNVLIKDYDESTPVMLCGILAHPTVYQINFEKIKSNKIPEIIVCDASELKILTSKEIRTNFTEKDGMIFPLPSCKGYLKVIKKIHGDIIPLFDIEQIVGSKEWSWEDNEYIDSDTSSDSNKYDKSNLLDLFCCKYADGSSCIRPVLPCGHTITCCPICAGRDENIFNFDSEGKLVCKNCGTIDFDNIKFRCEVCKAPVRSGKVCQIHKESSWCAVCLDARATNFVLPCGHQCVCSRCMQELRQRDRKLSKCPICSRNIIKFGIDFLDNDK